MSTHNPAPHSDLPVSGTDENARGQYIGTDWREVLDRNVTVALEFAEYDLSHDVPKVERALALVREALLECRRLLASRSPQSETRDETT